MGDRATEHSPSCHAARPAAGPQDKAGPEPGTVWELLQRSGMALSEEMDRLTRINASAQEEPVVLWKDRLRAEGYAIGRAQAFERGRAEGRAGVLADMRAYLVRHAELKFDSDTARRFA